MDIGLRFRRVDLHTHTPASACFSDRDVTPNDIVQAAINAGMDAIAITDHNTGEWIDLIKEAAANTRLVVFPGVEITVSEGFHILAILDTDKKRAHVDHLLATVDIPVDEFGKSEALSKKGADCVIREIRASGGLAVLAHIDEAPRGAYAATSGNFRTRLFSESPYHAVETVTGNLPEDFVKGRGFKRLPATYQSSDNPSPEDNKKHSHQGIGTRCSWFKMDDPINLEGLRQCFADPQVRIRPMDECPSSSSPRILSVKFSGGFLADQEVVLNPGLNCLIGGKGVGKSLVIEFLRFALGQPSGDNALQKDQNNKLNMRLGVGETVQARVQTASGAVYSIKRTFGGDHSCVNLTSGEEYEGDIATLFPILAYSQTEVIKIAESENAQLELIDSFIDLQPYLDSIASICAELAENDRVLADALPAQHESDSLTTELSTVREQLKEYDELIKGSGADKHVLSDYRMMELKKTCLEDHLRFLEELKHSVVDSRRVVLSQSLPELPTKLRKDADVLKVRTFSASSRRNVIAALADIETEIEKEAGNAADMIESWLPTFRRKKADYDAELAKAGQKGGLEITRAKLADRARALNERLSQCRTKTKELPAIWRQRRKLLKELAIAHSACYRERKTMFDLLAAKSEGKLKLGLSHAANSQEFEDRLKEMLSGTATRSDAIQAVASNLSASDLVKMVLSRDAEALAEQTTITVHAAQKIIDRLNSFESLEPVLALEHDCYPTDVPSIQFRKDGNEYAPLSELSVGQKCTALIILALSEGTRPVVIDQPEDALDIRTVWEDVAQKLRVRKDDRQFILTSHNATVVVSSDSDTCSVLTSTARQARIRCLGGIECPDVKAAVIEHLEGGDVPYDLRRTKYNRIPNS